MQIMREAPEFVYATCGCLACGREHGAPPMSHSRIRDSHRRQGMWNETQ